MLLWHIIVCMSLTTYRAWYANPNILYSIWLVNRWHKSPFFDLVLAHVDFPWFIELEESHLPSAWLRGKSPKKKIFVKNRVENRVFLHLIVQRKCKRIENKPKKLTVGSTKKFSVLECAENRKKMAGFDLQLKHIY